MAQTIHFQHLLGRQEMKPMDKRQKARLLQTVAGLPVSYQKQLDAYPVLNKDLSAMENLRQRYPHKMYEDILKLAKTIGVPAEFTESKDEGMISFTKLTMGWLCMNSIVTVDTRNKTLYEEILANS